VTTAVAAGATLLLFQPSAAAYPETLRAVLDVDTTPVDVTVSPDDRLVGIVGADGTLSVLDTADWTTVSTAACSEATSVAFVETTEKQLFYVGCTDGTVAAVTVDDSAIPTSLGSVEVFELGTGSISGLAATEAPRLFAVEDLDGESSVHTVDPESGATNDLGGFPVASIYTTHSFAATPLGTYLVMGNDQGRVSKVYNAGGTYHVSTYDLFGLGTFGDAACVDEGYAYLADDSGLIVQYYLTGDNSYMTLANDLGAIAGFDLVEVVEGSFYLYVADEQGGLVIVAMTGGDPIAELELGFTPAGDLAPSSAADGMVYVGGEEATLGVVGAAPWVEIVGLSPQEVFEGETATLTFTVDSACSYDIYRGGGIDRSGTALGAYSGVAEAGDTVELEIDGGDLEEGDNRLFVFAESGGYTGRDSDTVYLDTPPDAISGFELSFGDEKLIAAWTTNPETDISHYLVYFADEYFDESTGAPDFQAIGEGAAQSSPVSVGHTGEEIDASATLQYLTNGVEYCVAVVAEDLGGLQGPWTETLCDSPEQTLGAGDAEGYCGTCTTTGGRGSAAAIVALLALAAVHRRSVRR